MKIITVVKTWRKIYVGPYFNLINLDETFLLFFLSLPYLTVRVNHLEIQTLYDILMVFLFVCLFVFDTQILVFQKTR